MELPAPAKRTLGGLVERLAHFDAGAHWVTSCYLKLEPRDRARGKYLIKLKNRIKARLAWLEQRGVSRVARDNVERDLTRIRDYLQHPGNLPPGRGIALFACGPLELFEAIPLPQVFRSRLVVDHTPLIRELAAVDDEFGLVLCALYDRTSARFFQVTASGVAELTSLAAGDATRAGKFHGASVVAKPGPAVAASGEHNFNQRIRVEKQRHYAAVAQRLFELARAGSVRGVVLGGMGADAKAVEPHLHPYVAKQMLGTVRINPKSATPALVMESVLKIRRQTERQWEAEHVAALLEGLGTGWAVNGIEPALEALARGQVRTLLVDAEVAEPGFRCGGRLTVSPDSCGSPDGAEPIPDVVDEAIEEALRQQSHLDVIEDESARAAVDGLAALLRFR